MYTTLISVAQLRALQAGAKALAEADKLVYDMGFELDEDTVRAKYGEGWSKKAAALPAPAPGSAPTPLTGRGSPAR